MTLASSFLGSADPELLDWIGGEIDGVEDDLATLTASAVSPASDIGRHTLKSGGKRLRPAFTILSAAAAGCGLPPIDQVRVRRFAAVMEMIHMATLIHDDVIDGSPSRRGQATAHQVFGVTESILSGDVLLARAMASMARDGDVEVTRTASEAVVEVAEGEVRELAMRGCFDISEADHLEILRMKTASFIRGCCEIGAQLAGATDEVRMALRTYGEHIGLAFQIADDILDYRGKGSETGKPAAIDFRDGQATLPLICLRHDLSTEEQSVLRSRFGNGVSDDEIRMICGWMDTRGAFKKAEEMALAEIDKGKRALEVLPESPYRKLLGSIADYVTGRRA